MSITIPAYMVWFAILYADRRHLAARSRSASPWSRSISRSNAIEADFRFSLVRLRENAESVALYGGEPREHTIFLGRFNHVVDNFWAIMRGIKALGWWTYFYGQFAIIFPYLVSAPRFLLRRDPARRLDADRRCFWPSAELTLFRDQFLHRRHRRE